jgi:hypothetical protein
MTKYNVPAKLIGIVLGVSLKTGYVLSTPYTKEIEIVDKYQLVKNGLVNNMVVNSDGDHFVVSRSLLYWSFYTPEIWQKLEVGKSYNAVGYGIRWGFIGLFPAIVRVKEFKW